MSDYYEKDLTSGRAYLSQGDRQARNLQHRPDSPLRFQIGERFGATIPARPWRRFLRPTVIQERPRSGVSKEFSRTFNKVEDNTLSDFWNTVRAASKEAAIAIIPRHPRISYSSANPRRRVLVSPWSLEDTAEKDASRAVSGILPGVSIFTQISRMLRGGKLICMGPCLIHQVRLFNRIDSPPIMQRSAHLAIKTSLDGLEWTTVFTKTDDAVFGGVDGSPADLDSRGSGTRATRAHSTIKERLPPSRPGGGLG